MKRFIIWIIFIVWIVIGAFLGVMTENLTIAIILMIAMMYFEERLHMIGKRLEALEPKKKHKNKDKHKEIKNLREMKLKEVRMKLKEKIANEKAKKNAREKKGKAGKEKKGGFKFFSKDK